MVAPAACRFHPVSFPPCTIHSTNRRSDLLLGLVVPLSVLTFSTYWPLCRNLRTASVVYLHYLGLQPIHYFSMVHVALNRSPCARFPI